jgi:hypothetical protein
MGIFQNGGKSVAHKKYYRYRKKGLTAGNIDNNM